MRFALNPGDLELEHERFGPHGWWSAVRDGAEHAVSDAVLEPTVTAEHLYGTKRRDLDAALGRRVTESMRSNSVTVTSFSLGGCSLGRTGDVVAATARARFEIEREQAESAVRRVMADNALS